MLDFSRVLATKLTIGYLENEHNYKSALKDFLSTTPNTPEGNEILLCIGDMFNSCQNPVVAAKIYERLYTRNKNAKVLEKIVDCCTRSKQSEKAMAAILNQLEKNSQNETAVDLLVVNAEATEELDKAITAVNNLSKSSPAYYKALSKLHLAQGKMDEAIAVLNKGVKKGFQSELNLDFANAYYHNEEFSKALPYFEDALKDKQNTIIETDYALCLMRCNEYQKAWKTFCDMIKKDSLPTMDSYILAMQACLYSYSEDFVNIGRSERQKYESIQDSYLNDVKLFEEKIAGVISLDYAKKYQVLSIIGDTKSVLRPMPNPSFLPNRKEAELNFDNLPIVFSNWLKKPYVTKLLTKTEIEQIRSDIQSAIENRANPYFSYAGCMSSLHAYVEKYAEPVFYFYLTERIGALQQKSIRYEKLKEETLAQIRKKSDKKNEMLAARKNVPKELKSELDQLMNFVIFYSMKVDKISKKCNELLEIKRKNFNLGLLVYITSIISKEKIEALKNQEASKNQDTDEADDEENRRIRIINPAFGKYLKMHQRQLDSEQDMQLFGVILQSNIESYRFLRNDAVHGNTPEQEKSEELDEFGDPKHNWDTLYQTPIVTKETFFDLLNIALFSPTSIFYYLNELTFPETQSEIERFYKTNSSSARNCEIEK